MKRAKFCLFKESGIMMNPDFFRISGFCCAYNEIDDDLPTDLGGSGAMGNYADSQETQIPGGRPAGGYGDTADTSLGSDTYIREMDQTMLAVPELGTLAMLWVKEGERRGKIYKIKEGDILGKRDGSLILDDPKVSTPHCRFRMEKEKFVLWDCGSKNGTFVNGKRITCATTLEENDLIKIGDITFVLKILPNK
jgi:hypothetical protein